MALDADDRLRELEDAGLLRALRDVEGPQGPELELDGRRVVCLCSNNYLGLADHPTLLAAAREALATEGLGAGASRLISGTMAAHRRAETRLAELVGAPTARLFATGYAANVGTIQALVGRGDAVFSDALNHASLIDGCRLSRATTHVYQHRDAGELERLLAQHRSAYRRALVVTDGLFSMDGDRAPVAELRALCDRYDAALLVDEAHALGVLGPNGRGVCAEAGTEPDVLVGTLGKAFGVAGAFVAGDASVIRLVENLARSFVFSTAPPPPLAAAAAAAADLVAEADARRAALRAHAGRLREGLRAHGWQVPEGDTPVVPVIIGGPSETMRISQALLSRDVFAQGIRPPTVPDGSSRIRLTVMATHEPRHIDAALAAFEALSSRSRRARSA